MRAERDGPNQLLLYVDHDGDHVDFIYDEDDHNEYNTECYDGDSFQTCERSVKRRPAKFGGFERLSHLVKKIMRDG